MLLQFSRMRKLVHIVKTKIKLTQIECCNIPASWNCLLLVVVILVFPNLTFTTISHKCLNIESVIIIKQKMLITVIETMKIMCLMIFLYFSSLNLTSKSLRQKVYRGGENFFIEISLTTTWTRYAWILRDPRLHDSPCWRHQRKILFGAFQTIRDSDSTDCKVGRFKQAQANP